MSEYRKKIHLYGAFLLVCACSLPVSLNAGEQPAELVWTRAFNGGAGVFDIAWDVTIDDQNSPIVSGVSIDQAKSISNRNDTRLIKFNSGGDVVWSKVFDSGTNDAGFSVVADDENNIYTAGPVSPSEDPYQADCRVLKLTAAGEVIWDKTFSLRRGKTNCYSMAIYGSTSIYVAGTLDSVYYTTMTADAFLFKINNNGDMQWAKITDNGFADQANALTVDGHGDIIIAGDSQVSISPGNIRRVFLAAKFTAGGRTVFLNNYRAVPDNAQGSVTGLDIDMEGNVLLGGSWGTWAQQGTLYVKISTSGEVITNKFTPRPSWTTYWAPYGEGVSDKSGNLYLAGYFYDNGQSYMAFNKISPEGSILWSQKPEQSSVGYANSLALDHQGDIYLAGLSYTSDTPEGMGSMVLEKYHPASPMTLSVSLAPNSAAPGTVTRVVVEAKDSSGPKPDIDITLVAEPVSYSGGHNHDTGRPVGTFSGAGITGSPAHGATGEDGKLTAVYTASAFGGLETIKAYLTDNPGVSAATPLEVKIMDSEVAPFAPLRALPDGLYIKDGGTCLHHGAGAPPGCETPDNNHYGTYKTVSNLQAIALAMSLQGLPRLEVNDMSLPYGGGFDINGQWELDVKAPGCKVRGHCSHRKGNQVDIQVYPNTLPTNLSRGKLEKLVYILKVNGNPIVSPESDHWHLTFK